MANIPYAFTVVHLDIDILTIEITIHQLVVIRSFYEVELVIPERIVFVNIGAQVGYGVVFAAILLLGAKTEGDVCRGVCSLPGRAGPRKW